MTDKSSGGEIELGLAEGVAPTGSSAEQVYEAPGLIYLGNVHALLAGASGPKQDTGKFDFSLPG